MFQLLNVIHIKSVFFYQSMSVVSVTFRSCTLLFVWLFTVVFPLNWWVRFLQKELEKLRDAEQEIQNLQQEVDEDTTEVIPSAM